MYAVFLKEIRSFFSSVIAYVVISVFLTANGVFLFIIPDSNIFDFGYASLDQFFQLSPWVFLFLVPAITMRSFAEERRTGTFEIILTKPVSETQLILAKYFANLILVIISLLPTLIYYVTIYFLADPIGNVDSGAFWGSFIGLIFLASAYVALGIFASVINENQIISFITGLILCYVFYQLIDLLRGLLTISPIDPFLEYLSIGSHYESISRGVVDTRDIVYFLSLNFVFLYFTRQLLIKRKW